ncbi:amidohydrolase [Desulfosarcina widdelii]|jgi:imidazolonepropionase-like amidohydrolase|uniref:Amidohydrolase n=1 Tax=Desulfosarcina widdelii TaxID=947919 RepID=A0A5K7Z116_9BACT|nr:amidohydrolase family protein [Desulfosarcina widdelii]BBO73161.1 amidohydrolase [Desulfosarcina widdelii]
MNSILIEGENLFDGNNLVKDEPAVVMVREGYIEAVGEEAQAKAADASKTIQCPGQTLMPGMVDCHNHLSLDPRLPDYLLRMLDPVPELTLKAVETMDMDLKSGVTTSRCLGDKEFLDVHCKNAQAEGRLLGPRLIVATRGIRALHGHGFVGNPYCGVNNIRQAVRENLYAGADLIKIYLTGSLMGPKGLPCYFSEDEVRILVDEAHRASVPVATHCIGGPAVNLAIKCGIDVIEHGYFLNFEDLDLISKNERWLVLTPSLFFTDDRLDTLHNNLKKPHIDQRPKVAEAMSAAVKGGVKYAIGTDGMHGRLADEVEYVVSFGASPADALAGVTSRAAELCGMADLIGTVEKGKRADLIGVVGNPLDKITDLKHVQTIIQNGAPIKIDKSMSC